MGAILMTFGKILRLTLLWAMIWSGPAYPSSLFGSGNAFVNKATGAQDVPLVQVRATPDAGLNATPGGSLFADRERQGLFAPVIKPEPDTAAPLLRGPGLSIPGLSAPSIVALRSLIAKVEAGSQQYNAVVFSAHIKPPKLPTQMTLAEIYKWIDDTPGQNHAIGRYQFIPSTLRQLVRQLGVKPAAQFTPALQDRLADVLLEDAGLSRFLAGDLSRKGFMNNLAKIWAGLPNSSGKSHYAGIAGNKAGMSWSRFDKEMARIFPS